MKKALVGLAAALMLGLVGCEYAARSDDLPGKYRRPHTDEYLILRADGTGTVVNMPGRPAEMKVRWSRSSARDEPDCTWLDFEPTSLKGIEWHTCANRIAFKNTVFIGYPGADADEADSFYEKVN